MSNVEIEIPSFGKVNYELDLSNIDNEILIHLFSELIRIRLFELKCAQMKKVGDIRGPVHLAIGQEAIPVGISQNLRKSDSIYSAHRSHAHLLALGSDPENVFAEILGRSTGVSGGFGGSMHLVDKSVGFQGSVPIVAGTIPLAVGAAFAAKYRGTEDIAVVYFGDGALEEGVAQESLNLASIMQLPILFVCENNYMASHMHLSQRQAQADLTRFASANDIDSIRLDGNNPIEIFVQSKAIINKIRSDRKPFFIEFLTYRQLGHVDWREDIDVGVNRSKSDVEFWKRLDPILRLEQTLTKSKIATQEELNSLRLALEAKLEMMWVRAKEAALPNHESLLNIILEDLKVTKHDK